MNLEHTSQPLRPYRYPLWLCVFTLGVAALFGYVLALFPPYWKAGVKMREAERAYQSSRYDQAFRTFLEVFRMFPESREAGIRGAEAAFLSKSPGDDEEGLMLLQKLRLNDREWRRVLKVMPSFQPELFKKVGDS